MINVGNNSLMLNTHLLKKYTLVKERLRALFIKKVIIYMSYMNFKRFAQKGRLCFIGQ